VARDIVAEKLSDLADDLSSHESFGWELFAPEAHEAAYRLIINPAGIPRWSAFFRESALSAKLELLKSSADPICYWTILLSSVGPFWLGWWDCFAEVGGRVGPDPSGHEHSRRREIEARVGAVLADYGLRRVAEDTARKRVPVDLILDDIVALPNQDAPTFFSYLFSKM
jgi:hypothetical protein